MDVSLSVRTRASAATWKTWSLLGLALASVSSCLTPSFNLAAPDAHCKNGALDSDESDKDCGGDTCSSCALQKKCKVDTDCAIERCVEGKCAEASCFDGRIDEGETDTDCGGVCEATCADGKHCAAPGDCQSDVCTSSTCVAVSCADGRQNNAETDTDCGGAVCKATCEVGQLCKTNGDCRQPDDAGGAELGTAQCALADDAELRCVFVCPPRRGDCDRLALTGCETNTDTSLLHCGACMAPCDLPGTSQAHCDFGTCQIDECEPGFDDCDPEVPGCETNLGTDPDHCGSCETDCSNYKGTDTCGAGVCGINCDKGFADCDAATNPGKNGCETNILANVNNCGGCSTEATDFVCDGGDVEAFIFPVCLGGKCEEVNCSTYGGTAACNGDGKCNDEISTPENCGGCGVKCFVENGEPKCSLEGAKFQCGIQSCDANYDNCDDSAVDCEVDIRTNVNHCGGCAGQGGRDCGALIGAAGLHVAEAACEDKACSLSCETGFADCDWDPANGCEADASSSSRCGGCLPTDAAPGNGSDCDAVYPDADVVSCSVEGVCEVSCNAGLCPDETGNCDVPLGSVASCLTCGDVCSAPAGAIASCNATSGCQVIHPVKVVQSKSAYNTATTSAPDLSVAIDVGSGPSRGLVILASTAHTPVIKLGTTVLTPISSILVPSHTGYATISFVNDAELGAAGTKTITVSSTWGGKVLSVLELNDVAQTAARDTNTKTGSGCATNINQLTDVSTPGSLVVAALHLQITNALSGTPQGLTELIDQYAPDQLTGLNGYQVNVNASPTVGWTVSGSCWNYALVTASFNPRVASE